MTEQISMAVGYIKKCIVVRKHIEDNPEKFVINFDQLVSFLENTQGNADILAEANRYTPKTNLLIDMIYNIYPHLTEKSIKTKCTKTMQKLKKQIKSDILETQSNISIDSTDTDRELSQTSDHEKH